MRKHRILSVLVSLLAIAGVEAQELPADINPDSGARLPYTTRGEVGEAGVRVADIFARGGPETPLSGPLAWAAYNPHVATALLDVHDGAMGQSTLSTAIRELSVLVACRETDYTLEWNAHVGQAANAGISQEAIEIVREGKAIRGLSDEEAAVIQFGRELLGEHRMGSDTFATAVELFGERGTMDIVAVMMTYAVSGFYAIAVDEHLTDAPMLEPLR
jgi:4-carboxymuconolactone decarboxylase